jgi:hypothetical protein
VLVLAPWKESTTQRCCVATSVRGEVTPGREKGGDDDSCVDANLIGPKNKENPSGRFSCYK